MNPITIKICGLTTEATMAAALDAGADMVALNFHPKSPRFVALSAASRLAAQAREARGRAQLVALVVDLDDEALRAITAATAPDLIQCHGQEDEARLAEIASLTGRPVMKAFGVAMPADLAGVAGFASAGRILLDAKAPKDATYPGGHGKPFDWSILADLPSDLPFMLSGGLNPDSVATAITTVRGLGRALTGVDVSSGVESAPGLKDIDKIRHFIRAAREADAASIREPIT